MEDCAKIAGRRGTMGIYVNPGNVPFQEAVNSQIYVDKSELITIQTV